MHQEISNVLTSILRMHDVKSTLPCHAYISWSVHRAIFTTSISPELTLPLLGWAPGWIWWSSNLYPFCPTWYLLSSLSNGEAQVRAPLCPPPAGMVIYLHQTIFPNCEWSDPSLRNRRQHARPSGSGPELDSRSGKVSWVRWFREFSSPLTQMSGSFRPGISFGHYNHPFILAFFEWTGAWMVSIVFLCSCSFGVGSATELIPHPWRSSMSLCGQKSMFVIQS